MITSIAFVLLLQPTPPAVGTIESQTMCTSGAIERSVTVLAPAETKACEVRYDKTSEGGSVEVLWSANNDASYCAPKAEGLVERLEGWGWDCALTDTTTPTPEAATAPAAPTQAAETPEAPDAPEAAPVALPAPTSEDE